jgi:hypothetical protein
MAGHVGVEHTSQGEHRAFQGRELQPRAIAPLQDSVYLGAKTVMNAECLLDASREDFF